MSAGGSLDAAVLSGQLAAELELHVATVVDSTNDEVRRLAAGSRAPAVLLVAEAQTAGRGRHGRRWHSPAGGGVYLSLLLRPASRIDGLARWTIAAGVASCRALERCGAHGVALEWPNDLVLDGRKLGGVLVESRTRGRAVVELVIGVGLNLRPLGPTSDPSLRERTASLDEAARSAPAPSRETVAVALSRALLEVTRALLGGGWPTVARDWLDRASDAPGRRVEVTEGDRSWRGTTNGLGEDGALLVRADAGGAEREVRLAGSVRPLGD